MTEELSIKLVWALAQLVALDPLVTQSPLNSEEVGTPVVVVLRKMPVESDPNEIPLIFPTVVASDPEGLVISPVKAGTAAVGNVVTP